MDGLEKDPKKKKFWGLQKKRNSPQNLGGDPPSHRGQGSPSPTRSCRPSPTMAEDLEPLLEGEGFLDWWKT